MKIAFVNDTFLEGRGADTVIYELAKRIGRKHEVYIIASEVNGFKEENFKTIKIDSKKLYTGSIKDYAYLWNIIKLRKAVIKLHKKYNFDVLNVHHSALSPAFYGLPMIVTWYGSPITKNKIRKIINRFILKNLNNNGPSITISNCLGEMLKKMSGKKKVEITPLGVSNEFVPTGKDKEYMLFVGRCELHKEINEIIKVSKELDFPLFIAGSGPELQNLINYAKRINAKKVTFLGKVGRKKLIKLYQNCSFFISASKWEGFGLIFLEAAACGKPSIGYNKYAIPEVIKNGETGFLANDYSELKNFARNLIHNKKIRKRLGEKSVYFSKKFNWNSIAERYIMLLNKNIKLLR